MKKNILFFALLSCLTVSNIAFAAADNNNEQNNGHEVIRESHFFRTLLFTLFAKHYNLNQVMQRLDNGDWHIQINNNLEEQNDLNDIANMAADLPNSINHLKVGLASAAYIAGINTLGFSAVERKIRYSMPSRITIIPLIAALAWLVYAERFARTDTEQKMASALAATYLAIISPNHLVSSGGAPLIIACAIIYRYFNVDIKNVLWGIKRICQLYPLKEELIKNSEI